MIVEEVSLDRRCRGKLEIVKENRLTELSKNDVEELKVVEFNFRHHVSMGRLSRHG